MLDWSIFPAPETRGRLVNAAASLGAVALLFFLYRLYQVRMMVRRAISNPDIFAMPHSFLFGHIPAIAKAMIKHKAPRDAHGQSVPWLLAQEYPQIMKDGLVYMDVWPMSNPTISVFHPDIMAQFTQEKSQLKHPNLAKELMPFSAASDLVSLDGSEWKTQRAIFNPGFSVRNLMALIPSFVEEALVFRDLMKKAAARGEVIKMVDYSTSLTVDIIARAVLGTRVHAQTKPPEFMQAMIDQVGWLYFDFEWKKALNPLRPIKHYFYNRTFRDAMMPYVKHTVANYEKISGPKTILNLAVKSYVEEVQDASARAAGEIPHEFLEKVINHTKIFLFAGHDTTATTIAYALYELSSNPRALSMLRAEHDAVLGTDAATAAERIAADPSLLNQLPLTLGVVKETLRLWPVVGTVRIGAPGYTLRHPETGVVYPAGGFMLFGCSFASQRFPEYWARAEEFLPERFVTRDPADPLYVANKNAFRPWEQGPRNCIGQELASLELRLILALTVREYDFEPAYAEDAPEFMGLKAYQVQPPEMITGHPKDGMPMKVRMRKV